MITPTYEFIDEGYNDLHDVIGWRRYTEVSIK